jgi:hypothetical protein
LGVRERLSRLSGNLREVRHEYGLEGNGEGKLKE